MTDRPEAEIENSTWTFETSVIAREGADAGLVYGVVMWSFSVDGKLQITDTKPTYRQTPTAQFGTAVAAWNTQAANDPQSRDGQVPLPVQRSVAQPPPTLMASTASHTVGQRDRAMDAATRGRMALALQRSVGNRAARVALGQAPALQLGRQLRGGEVHKGS